MHKHNKKKLTLNKHSVRSLALDETELVAAGGGETSNCPTRLTCGAVCTGLCSCSKAAQ